MTVTVVTGASSGIGLATVVRLADEGHTVYAGVRNPEGSPKLHDAIATHAHPDRIRVLTIDVDDDASVEAAFASVVDEAGPVDVLVNNAGVSGSSPLEELDLAELRRQMETNVFGLLRCTQAVIGSMRERRSGAVVNVGSLAGRFVRGGMGAYAATKHAVEALSDALAQEVAPFDVRVVLVEPGVIATDIWQKSATSISESNYPMVQSTTIAYFLRMLQDPTPASAVADVIAAALVAEEPKLRHAVGWDAVATLAARPSVSDEDLIAMARLDVDGWVQRFGELFFPLTAD